MIDLNRRVFLGVLLATGVVGSGAQTAAAQAFPSRQMKLIVPFAAGGGADIIGRTIAERLGTLYGKTVIVENMPGGGSNIGINNAAKAEPDGHTLVLGAIALATNSTLYRAMPFDPVKDLTPLTLALETPNIVIVPATSDVKSIGDLIAAAKARPLSYGSAGVGSSLHLAAELFKQQAKIDMTHVPYRGSSPALADLMAGRIDVMFDNASTALPQVQGGTARAIAVTTKARIAQLPEVPTVAESGLPDYEMGNWWGLLVSAKTPAPVAQKLSADLLTVLADPAVKKAFEDLSGRIIAANGAEFATYIDRETQKWQRVIEAAGMRGSQ